MYFAQYLNDGTLQLPFPWHDVAMHRNLNVNWSLQLTSNGM